MLAVRTIVGDNVVFGSDPQYHKFHFVLTIKYVFLILFGFCFNIR